MLVTCLWSVIEKRTCTVTYCLGRVARECEVSYSCYVNSPGLRRSVKTAQESGMRFLMRFNEALKKFLFFCCKKRVYFRELLLGKGSCFLS